MYPMFGLARRWMFTAGIAISIADYRCARAGAGQMDALCRGAHVGVSLPIGIGAYGMMERQEGTPDRLAGLPDCREQRE